MKNRSINPEDKTKMMESKRGSKGLMKLAKKEARNEVEEKRGRRRRRRRRRRRG